MKQVVAVAAACAALFAGAAFGASQVGSAGAAKPAAKPATSAQVKELKRVAQGIERDVAAISSELNSYPASIGEGVTDARRYAQYSCANTKDILRELGLFGGFDCP